MSSKLLSSLELKPVYGYFLKTALYIKILLQVQTQLTDVKKEIQEVNWTRKDQQTQVFIILGRIAINIL